ncbi:MAG TPA: ATP-binding protein [Roseiflexaceae bacterium]|nr:ATP-binding protein [Roseiflexaceae bacterium]
MVRIDCATTLADPERLRALYQTQLLDTGAEEAFDRFTRLASRLINAPIALLSLVDTGRQFFKSAVGLAEPVATKRETPLSHSFCQYVVADGLPLVVADARYDERLKDNLAIPDLGVIAYAGIPLPARNGAFLGSFCVIDTAPREWTATELAILNDLAAAVIAEIHLREEIYERQQTEVTLRASQRFLQGVIDALTAHIAVLDADGTLIAVNAAWQEFAERNNGGLNTGLGSNYLTVCDSASGECADGADAVAAAIRQIIAGERESFVVEYPCHSPQQPAWYVVRISRFFENDKIRVVVAHNNITERKLAEIALSESEQKMRALLTAVPDKIFRLNAAGVFLDYIPAADDTISPADMIGRTVEDLMPPEIAALMHTQIKTTLASGVPHMMEYQIEQHGVAADCEVRLVASGADEVLAIARDMTERKKIERLKNEFVSVVSHELRTPLTAIRGSLGLIGSGVLGELPPKAAEMIAIASKNSERLVRLINDILDMDKIESGKMVFQLAPIDLVTLTRQTINETQGYAAEFGVELVLHAAMPVATVQADADRLGQVLANLISNAAKYAPRGSCVEVTIRGSGTTVSVDVTDYGPGIPLEFHDRIFQKFAQADTSNTRRSGGTGLGLAISHAIVERLGGQLSFTTELGRGTTFTMTLPLPHQAATQQLVLPARRLLICEHTQAKAEVLMAMLIDQGIMCDLVLEDEQARRHVADTPYDGVIVSLQFLAHGGLAFVREFRTLPDTTELPLIIVSTDEDAQHNHLRGEAFDVTDWIDLSHEPTRLPHVIARALSRSHTGRARILHVEDDRDLQRIVAAVLNDIADVTAVDRLADARLRLSRDHFDLVLLDALLPDGSGLELIRQLNGATPSIPAVLFSASEFDPDRYRDLVASLVKSRTSNTQLRDTITGILAQQRP